MKEIQANIQLNGFTVRIVDGVTIFFETSQENITRLMSIDEKDSKLNEMKKSAELTLKPLDVQMQKEIKENVFNQETVNKSIAAQVQLARELYDYIYGEGVFDNLYSKIHDVTFWLENMEEIFQATLKGLEEEGKAKKRRMLEAQKKYINKKKKKRNR